MSPPPVLSPTATTLNPRATTTTTAQLNPSSPSPHSSSSSYQQQHSSPTTVQTNISPATVYNHNHDKNSYIQKQQLPPPPNASINTVGLTVVPTPAHSLKYTPYNLQDHVNNQHQLRQQEDNSRASSAALQNLISSNNHVDNDVESVDPAPPVIVDSMPRDRVMISEEYRTLTREDELRQSIKLKESSLI